MQNFQYVMKTILRMPLAYYKNTAILSLKSIDGIIIDIVNRINSGKV